MKRGLTMIELLVSLGIFSGVMLGVVSWIQTTTRTSSLVEPMRWLIAAEAVLQLIHDDLIIGDFPTDRERHRRNTPPQVRVSDNVLEIRTRSQAQGQSASSATHRYSIDRLAGTLQRKAQYPRGMRDNRLLLDNVREWLCTINDEAQTLSVSIISENNQIITRSYRLP